MIKRFNENWGPLKRGSRKGNSVISIDAIEGDSLNDSLEKALKIAKREYSNIILNINDIELKVSPQNTIDEVKDSYHKQIKYAQNDNDYWKDYWEEKSKDPDFEMDTISDYAMRHSISRDEAIRHFSNNRKDKENDNSPNKQYNTFDEYLKATSEPKFSKGDTVYDYTYRMYGRVIDYKSNKEDPYLIDFEDGTSVWLKEEGLIKGVKNILLKSELNAVVGLPSGQIIYMTDKQVTYFKARGVIEYRQYLHKLKDDSDIEAVKIDSYTFKDSNYRDIVETIKMWVW